MARLDLSDLGCRVASVGKVEIVIDTTELIEKTKRLRAAAEALEAAWADMPPGIRDAYVFTLRLGDTLEDPVKPDILDTLREPIAILIRAAADGRITPDEGADLLESLLDVAREAASGVVPDLVRLVGDLLHRDADELEAAAARAEARGNDKRAARLRARAERRA